VKRNRKGGETRRAAGAHGRNEVGCGELRGWAGGWVEHKSLLLATLIAWDCAWTLCVR
jgi:hypothetical protein